MTRLAGIARGAWSDPVWRAYLIWLPINFAWTSLWPAPGGLAAWIPVFAFLGFLLGWSIADLRAIDDRGALRAELWDERRAETASLHDWAASVARGAQRYHDGLVVIAARLGSEDHGDTDQQVSEDRDEARAEAAALLVQLSEARDELDALRELADAAARRLALRQAVAMPERVTAGEAFAAEGISPGYILGDREWLREYRAARALRGGDGHG